MRILSEFPMSGMNFYSILVYSSLFYSVLLVVEVQFEIKVPAARLIILHQYANPLIKSVGSVVAGCN